MQFENILQRASFCKVHCNKPLNYNVLVIRNVSTLWGAEKACAFKSAVKNIYLYTLNIVIDIITLKSFICVSCKLNVRVLLWLLSETGVYHNNFSGIQWFSKFQILIRIANKYVAFPKLVLIGSSMKGTKTAM